MPRLCILLFLVAFSGNLVAQDVTWSEDIAPLIYENCSSCHHDGGIAPFELMSYNDVNTWIGLIHEAVVVEKTMPPWRADPNYRNFTNETYLQPEEIAILDQWIDDLRPYGDPALEPDPPTFPESGSLLEQVDLVLQIPNYTLQSNYDEYRWFVIPNPYNVDVYIEKIEVLPGLRQVVHHADLFYDITGNSAANDAADPLSGFNSSSGNPTNSGYVNAWQPGANIAEFPEDWGYKIPAGADFVFEIHYGPGGVGLVDSTKMNLQLRVDPSDMRELKSAWLLTDYPPVLIDGPLVIPANQLTTFHQERTINQDLSFVAICPHMHLLGKSYKVWFETPQGDSIPLIDIPQWDFHWQKYYVFQSVQKIPAGSTIKSVGVYDNTLDNHDQPNNPPITVTSGLTTEDEMFLCYFIYANYQAGDENIILDSDLLLTEIDQIEKTESAYLFPNPASAEMQLVGDLGNTSELRFRMIDVLVALFGRKSELEVMGFSKSHLMSTI